MPTPLTCTGRIVTAKRIRLTPNGNPRVQLELEIVSIDGIPATSAALVTVKTAPDSSYVYDVLNETRDGSEPRDPEALYSFKLDGHGNLGKLVKLDPETIEGGYLLQRASDFEADMVDLP
jgi:hypothetical protein